MDIKELEQQGHSIRSISRETGYSRNTIRRVVRGEHPGERDPVHRRSKLDPYRDYLKERYEAHGLSAVRLMAEIEPMGYTGSIATVRRYLRTLRGEDRRKHKVTVRFETPPGHQAQADWGHCGRFEMPDGRTVSVYVFVMVLGYSRQLFVHFTTSMKMASLIDAHQKAFDYFGGWPAQILYDNMKQVRLSRARWNEQFLDFAEHYGFTPKTHRPYRPRTKGKVERAVDYVKDNFLRGRTFEGLQDLNAQGMHWLEHTANVRVHATTKARPVDLFEKEQPTLTTVSSVPAYRHLSPVHRTVSWESLVHFEGSRYSVPPAFAGQTVQVHAEHGTVLVRCGDTAIAEHQQAMRAGQSIMDKDHLAELWKLTEQQTRAPERPSWNLQWTGSVQEVPLRVFDEVLR